MQNLENNELYNVPLIRWRMRDLNMTNEQLAEKSGLSLFSVYAFRAGQLGTFEKAKQGFDALGLHWAFATYPLPESQFHRAVIRTANSKVAR